MKKGNKNKLVFISLIASEDIILHGFEVINHMDKTPLETYSDYPHMKLNGRSTVTLQIERIKK